MNSPKVRAVLSYDELVSTPKLTSVFTRQAYMAREVFIDPEEIWQAFQILLGQMVSDPEFQYMEADAYPTNVIIGLTEEDEFYIWFDNDIELVSPISFEVESNPMDVAEALKITRIVMNQIPKRYEDKELMFDRPLYPSEADKDGRIFGELINRLGNPEVLVEYDIKSGEVVFEGLQHET